MNEPETPPQDRRDFIAKACAVCVGTAVVAIPAVAGLAVLFDPLRHKAGGGAAVMVTLLDALPENGEPRIFQVVTTKVDAWNRTANVPVGSVYLQRTGATEVRALNVVCPHTGCFVNYAAAQKGFNCPCHGSNFHLDGTLADTTSPSPRGMDPQAVEIRNANEVWVTFQNYRAGVKDRVPA